LRGGTTPAGGKISAHPCYRGGGLCVKFDNAPTLYLLAMLTQSSIAASAIAPGFTRDYRHNRVPGHTFFFTVRLRERDSTLLTEHISAFGEAIRKARTRKPFHVDAWVAMPDHAHAIWTLPPGDTDSASRWRAIKIAFSKALGKSRAAEGAIWQRHFMQHPIGDDDEYCRMVDYVHTNALRHGLCKLAEDWPWSSLHRFRATGLMAPRQAGSAHSQ
jgi:putative transposase